MMQYLRNKKRYMVLALRLFLVAFFILVPVSITLHGVEPASAQAWCVPALGDCTTEIAKGILSTVATAVVGFCAMLLYLGGLALQLSMEHFVAGFSAWVTGSLGTTLKDLWTLVRDLCNLIFIFGFIYIGIKTIISPDDSRTKHFLSSIIIGAILINFSLYFTQVVIDFTNFIAVTIYNVITSNGATDIGTAVRTLLGLDSIYTKVSGVQLGNVISDLPKAAAYFTGISILFLVTALSFFGAALMLIVRFIELFLIMVFSPVIFAAGVFPQTEKYKDQIIHKLLSASFYAPAYLLMLYFTLRIAQKFNEKLVGGDPNFPKILIDGTDSYFGIILNFCIIIFLMWTSITLAHKMSVHGGQMVSKVSTQVRQRAQRGLGNAIVGVPAAAGRETVGQWAHNRANANGPGSLKDRAATSWWARQQLNASRKLGDASFDARGVGGVGAKLGIGDGGKGGHKTRIEAVQKKEKEYAQSLGIVDDSDMNVEVRKREMENAERELRKNKGRLQKIVNSTGPAKGQTVADWEDERNKALDDLEKLEKTVKDSKTNHEKERNRRAVGSSFAEETSDVKAKRASAEVYKQYVKDEWKKYDAALNAVSKAEAAVRKETADIEKAEREIAFARTNTERRTAELYRDAARTARDTAVKDRDAANQELPRARTAVENAKKGAKAKEEALAQALKTGSSDRGYAGVLENRGHIASWITGRTAHQNREAGKAVRKAGEAGFPKDKEDKH